ncbi:MAG: hypothetical protein ACYTFA_07715 [Planctomycetota bacterium]|jgi:hypothetical protein
MSPKKKRAYFTVMLISACALVVNSFVLSSDLPEPDTPTRKYGTASDASTSVPELPIPELPFPRGISPIDPAAEVPDLFAPPHHKRRSDGADADKPAGNAAQLSAPGHLSSTAFEEAHHLNGILVDQRLKIAGLDGQWVRIGTSVDGCTLTDIFPREVTFRCFDNSVILKLDGIVAGPER